MDLYFSDDLRVRFIDVADAPRTLCVVTFDSFNDLGTLHRPGFGEPFFESRRVPGIHVICKDNLWYQEPDLPQALAAIRRVTAGFSRVVAYGSSMGGYAAIRFGSSVGASTAIAISPQFSIDPKEVDFEIRWAQASKTIRFRYRAEDFPPVPEVFVFYDPYDTDHLHVERIAALYPTKAVRLPYSGHPVGSYLNETGLLTSTIEAICTGELDHLALERAARPLRRRSGQYLFSLARRVSVRRMETKLALARLAVARNAADAAYASYLALVLDRLGYWEEAERFHLQALDRQPGQPHILEGYARFLVRRARLADAFEIMQRAHAIGPRIGFVERSWVLVLMATGRYREAAQALPSAIRRNPVMLITALRDMARLTRWRLFGPVKREKGGFPPPNIRIPFGSDLAPKRVRIVNGRAQVR